MNHRYGYPLKYTNISIGANYLGIWSNLKIKKLINSYNYEEKKTSVKCCCYLKTNLIIINYNL